MNKTYTKREREHLGRVKSMSCIVCGQSAPSDAHHVKQKSAWHCIPLCAGCHTGVNGIHQQKLMWKIHKLDEVDAMAKLIERMANGHY